eukprot:1526055-Rhodomonas_salina.1
MRERESERASERESAVERERRVEGGKGEMQQAQRARERVRLRCAQGGCGPLVADSLLELSVRPDRQTDRQTDIQTDRQTERQTNRQTDRQTDRQADEQTERETARESLKVCTGRGADRSLLTVFLNCPSALVVSNTSLSICTHLTPPSSVPHPTRDPTPEIHL